MQTVWGLDGIAINCSIPRMRLCFVPSGAFGDSIPQVPTEYLLYDIIYKHKSQQMETTHFPIVSSSKSTTPGVIKKIRS